MAVRAPLSKVWVVFSNSGAYGLNADITIRGVYADRATAYSHTVGPGGDVQEFAIDYAKYDTSLGLATPVSLNSTSAGMGDSVEPSEISDKQTDKQTQTKIKGKAPKADTEADDEAKEKKPNKKDIIPEGNYGSLTGHTVCFLGSLKTMNRKTSEACAKKYGAEVTQKHDKSTFTVLGAKPGDNVEDEIANANGVTETEAGFYRRIGASFDAAGDEASSSKKRKSK